MSQSKYHPRYVFHLYNEFDWKFILVNEYFMIMYRHLWEKFISWERTKRWITTAGLKIFHFNLTIWYQQQQWSNRSWFAKKIQINTNKFKYLLKLIFNNSPDYKKKKLNNKNNKKLCFQDTLIFINNNDCQILKSYISQLVILFYCF